SLARRPITACVVGLLLTSFLSNLGNGRIDGLFDDGFEYSKQILFYLLLVGLVNSRSRLERYLLGLVGVFTVQVGLAVLQFYGVIALRGRTAWSIEPTTGARHEVEDGRLRGAGQFADPNDLCLVINFAIAMSLYGIASSRRWLIRISWLAPLALFVGAL